MKNTICIQLSFNDLCHISLYLYCKNRCHRLLFLRCKGSVFFLIPPNFFLKKHQILSFLSKKKAFCGDLCSAFIEGGIHLFPCTNNIKVAVVISHRHHLFNIKDITLLFCRWSRNECRQGEGYTSCHLAKS